MYFRAIKIFRDVYSDLFHNFLFFNFLRSIFWPFVFFFTEIFIVTFIYCKLAMIFTCFTMSYYSFSRFKPLIAFTTFKNLNLIIVKNSVIIFTWFKIVCIFIMYMFYHFIYIHFPFRLFAYSTVPAFFMLLYLFYVEFLTLINKLVYPLNFSILDINSHGLLNEAVAKVYFCKFLHYCSCYWS